jgi:amino-acid N-acetyltransferase
LLREAGLVPIDDAAQFGPQWVVAVDEGGIVVGLAGVEVHGDDGLLRSVVVAADLRMAGIGADLARDRVDWARGRGLGALYLLTTTAVDYWPRFGFARIDRAAAPPGIAVSTEWRSACPASAAAMRLEL